MDSKITIALLSAAVGALLGGIVNAAVARYAAFKESTGMAAALRAELLAILEIAEQRKYLAHLNAIIARLEQPEYVPGLGDLFAFRATRDFFAVFHATCSRIGTLAELAPAVTRIYVVATALVEDATMLNDLKESLWSGQQKIPLNREPMLSFSLSMR
jgi:hypothetical protein